jgi:hypothetical protein
MSECARPGCCKPGGSSCSVCVREQYCSSSCQKSDWKIHKPMCLILKKLSKTLQPYHEVTRLIDDILKSKKGNECRVVEHLLSFAEHQFGKGVPGNHYRERDDGDRISNWEAEIVILYRIIQRFEEITGEIIHSALLFKMTCAFLTSNDRSAF